MQIVELKQGGFCRGVKEAIAKAEAALEEYGKVYALGPIVHNEHVNARLQEKGLEIITVDDLDKIDKNYPVLLSAHGHTKKLEEQLTALGIKFIDATCVFVQINHTTMAHFNGLRSVIFVGHAGHEEAESSVTYASPEATLYDTISPKPLRTDLNKPMVFVQTTLSEDEVDSALRVIFKTYPQATFNHQTCTSTRERQDAIKELPHDFDGIFVVGSKTSSNANALLRTVKLHHPGTFTRLVKDADELAKKELPERLRRVAVIGAASTDQREITGIVEYFKKLK